MKKGRKKAHATIQRRKEGIRNSLTLIISPINQLAIPELRRTDKRITITKKKRSE